MFLKIFTKNYNVILRRKKATGTDGLPASFLKDSKDSIKHHLCHIINMSINTGVVPSAWKIARIIPIHKSGSTSDFDNYRPISVLPSVSKIIEKIVHKQLLTFLEENKLIYSHQFGFRNKMCTEHAVTLLLDYIRQKVDKGDMVGACFVDLSKAFDTISHSNLLNKLPRYGIHGQELAWFTDYLFHRKALVQYKQTRSDTFTITSGVPQGSILGPLLFLLLFNDLVDVVKHAQVLKYADDTVVYISGQNVKDISNLLSIDLSSISKWFEENELLMNPKQGKTEALLFGTSKRTKQNIKDFEVYANKSRIPITKEYKYLGVSVNSSLNMTSFFDKCYKKASSRLSLLAKLRYLMDVNVAKSIYQTMVLPALTYCGFHLLCLTATQEDKLASLHKRAEQIVKSKEIRSVSSANQKRACQFVKSCLDGNVIEPFKHYFTLSSHQKNTRNNDKMVLLPKIRTEYGRKSFQFTGGKRFNLIPLEGRSLNGPEFSNFIDNYYK